MVRKGGQHPSGVAPLGTPLAPALTKDIRQERPLAIIMPALSYF